MPADSDNVDIDVWAQGFDRETRDGLRRDLADGRLYVASFASDNLGKMDLLLWE